MIVVVHQLKNASNKLREQFIRCDFFGCDHPNLNIEIMPHLKFFSRKLYRDIEKNSKRGGIIYVKNK